MAKDTGLRKTEAAAPRDSATVMLVRDGDDGIEVFMMRRHGRADFGGAWVFPGGLAAVTDAESDLEHWCEGLDDAAASRQLGLPSGGLRFWVAAIRETFEESGYLLAVDDSGAFVDPGLPALAGRYAAYRREIDLSRMSLLELCRSEDIRLACDRLHYVSFWTTPEILPRRYATRFFVAAVPPGQQGVHDGRETVDCRWLRPADALLPESIGELRLHPPTVANLRLIRDFDTTAALIPAMASLDKARIHEILPRVVADGDGHRILLPGDPGYADAR